MKRTIQLFQCFLYLFFCVLLYSQTTDQGHQATGTNLLKQLMDQEDLEPARIELTRQVEYYKKEKNYDSLVKYVAFVGSFKLAENDQAIALKKASEFVDYFKEQKDPYFIKEALLELASLYTDGGLGEQSYKITKEALEYANDIDDVKKADKESILYNLGITARNYGDLPLSKEHLMASLAIRLNSKESNYEQSYLINNAMGGAMWYESKFDSAQYYFKESLRALGRIEDTPFNKHYRVAVVKGNLAVLQYASGEVDEAIKITKETVEAYNQFIKSSKDESRKLKAKRALLRSVDNLGAFYHGIGEYKRALELIEYSYQIKKKNLGNADRVVIISLVLLGQAKYAVRDFEGAGTSFDEAIDLVKKSKNTELLWMAAALVGRASVYAELDDIENAVEYYRLGEQKYRELNQNGYTRDFLDELIEMSLFYSIKGNDPKKAVSLAKESYDFVKSSDFSDNIQGFHHTVNLARVHFNLNDFEQSLKYSAEALNLSEQNIISEKSKINAIQFEYRKPRAYLIHAKSRYKLEKKRSEKFLNDLLHELNKGLDILERRKTIIKSADDLNLLLAENQELFGFAKQIYLELYLSTKKKAYLKSLIALNESAIYSRIRSRLNLKENLTFFNIPDSVIQKEKKLKKTLSSSMAENIDNFFEAEKEWNDFIVRLEKDYSEYHKMKYASIATSLKDIKDGKPDNSSIIRYLFIGDDLYAFVVTDKDEKLIHLGNESIDQAIIEVTNNNLVIPEMVEKLNYLYQRLWEPLEKWVTTEKVIIVPDGPLFNLSFEMLTGNQIDAYEELIQNSLLAKHCISYNYSLFLLNDELDKVIFEQGYIAFVPRFDKDMKSEYEMVITDSINLDKTYLNLSSLPFSADLAAKYAKIFKGEAFSNLNASKQVFVNRAKEHTIIHIGTHAESNNISPELSRLVFAKNVTDSTTINDNYLYTYEIYNHDLTSNLAILTACETGKPGYQPGEGMISLAHAFNYAGSESILTSLWEIDEQTSTQIVGYFYDRLMGGSPKDEALQQAKITYLKSAKGRALAPQYWAGLVLMGDTSPIEISTPNSWVWWLAIGALLILFGFWALKKIGRQIFDSRKNGKSFSM